MTRPAFADTDADIAAVVHDRLPDWDLTPASRRTAAQQLAAQGVHPAEIARLLGVSVRTVYRWQASATQPQRDENGENA